MESGCALPGEIFPDWAADFGRVAVIEVEIGPGRGGFALDHAELHRERDLVAIETRRSDCELIRERAAKRGLTNLLVLQGDAKLLLPWLFLPGTIGGVHVQFPDPWWKKRHHKRRMVDADLAHLLRRLLARGALVDFRTDVPNYAREAVATWEEAGFATLDGPGQLWMGTPEVLSTRERRYAVTAQPVFRARFENPAAAPLPPPGGRSGRDWKDVRRK